MRHRRIKCKLNRTAAHRKAMIRNMSASLLQYERINTTLPKAKEVRKAVENLISLAKREDLHARRQALRIVPNNQIIGKLFGQLASRYSERNGGYTRIYRMGFRKGDAAQMAVIELVDAEFDHVE